jgi:hypothetical protein
MAETITPTPAPGAEPPQFGTNAPQNFVPGPENSPPEPAPAEQPEAISWTASEFIAHEKAGGWYGMLVLAAVAGAALIYLLTKDKVSSAVVLVGALFLGIYANRQPRQLEYHLDNSGLQVGQKHYAYEQFRSFAIAPEGAFSSIVFTPLKRFAPYTTIYYDPADEEKIIRLISNHLPLEEHKADPVDNLMRRIRF